MSKLSLKKLAKYTPFPGPVVLVIMDGVGIGNIHSMPYGNTKPAALGDGSETLVNARMEDDTLVVDRVSRRLMLRAGSAVVGIWNEAFDLEGSPATGSTTVPGVKRVLKSDSSASSSSTGVKP